MLTISENLDLKTINDVSLLRKILKHNYRETKRHKNKYIDLSKKQDNAFDNKTSTQIIKQVKQAELKTSRLQAKSIRAVSFVASFCNKTQTPQEEKVLMCWIEKSFYALKKTIPKSYEIVSKVIHRDELNEHFHFIVLPTDQNGSLSWGRFQKFFLKKNGRNFLSVLKEKMREVNQEVVNQFPKEIRIKQQDEVNKDIHQSVNVLKQQDKKKLYQIQRRLKYEQKTQKNNDLMKQREMRI